MDKVAQFDELIVLLAPRVVSGLAIIAVSTAAAFLIRSACKRWFRKFTWGPRVGTLMWTTAFYGILVFGILTGLGAMGVSMTPIVASLGLGGFALGFALRDALSNLLAGMLIIIYRPFAEGDTISVAGCEGKVVEINLRYTVLGGEPERFMVPNSLIFTNILTVKPPKS